VLRQLILVAAIFLLVCSSATARVPRDSGLISGTVVDERNVAVAEAQVNVSAFDGRIRTSAIRFVETDAAGHFSIDGLAWGKYKVFAMKQVSGYPNMAFSFYSNDTFPTATITPAAPAVEIHIQLGPKAGTLSGSVEDAQTGAPVNAGFKLIRADSPDNWISTSLPSKYRVLLPAATDIFVEVSAPGYKDWTSPGPLRLKSGQEKRLDVALEVSRDLNLPASEFLVPDGYVGWLKLECNVEDAPSTAIENALRIFRFPKTGVLLTSSGVPEAGAQRHYRYYMEDNSVQDISTDYRSGQGMVWGEKYGSKDGAIGRFYFFVGTEEQYKKQANHGLQGATPAR
jgi:Carboxypeptidase regulatory-like domain